ncbi:hypothetical protein [Methylobacterium nigriterrae]|uniref:hypothetical protein n=1 Tax=Methylobacterium nigriterrae TaxID=3127512 RepID=UPI0030140535
MRASVLWTSAVLLTASVPALGQGFPSSNINSINNSLAFQGEMRALQQQQTTNFNTLNMQGQRNVLFQPQGDYYSAPAILPRGRGFGPAGPRHTGGVRTGRTGFDRSLDAGICVGC